MGSSTETLEYLVAGGVALLVSTLATSTSAALAALGEHRAEAILEAKERRPPAGLGRFVRRPDAVRLALLVVDSMAKAAFGMTAALASLSWLAARAGGVPSLSLSLPTLALAFAASAVFLLLVSTTARAAACRDPEKSLAWAAPVGAATEAALRPLIAPLGALSRLVRGPGARSQSGTTEQLEYLIEKGAEAGVLDDDERDLLESVIEFSHVRVREIMVPRPKVVALAADAPYDEVVRVVVESGHSRVPVYEDSVDNVIGVLYAKRLLEDLGKPDGAGKAKFRLASWVNPPFFVPETMKISHLLADFQRRGLQLAVVVDEFGGTSGVVTLEDVVEEIVGEIRDEDDDEEQPIRALAGGAFLAEGHVSIRDAEEFLEEALPGDTEFEFPEDGDYDTLGGFITAMAGRVPAAGEEVRFGGMVFTVRDADEKRVLMVELGLEVEPSAKGQGIQAVPSAPEPSAGEGAASHGDPEAPAESMAASRRS